jgi:hypothetical protein
MLGTGIGVAITGIVLPEIGGVLGADWKRREIEKYLRRRGNELFEPSTAHSAAEVRTAGFS